MPRQSNLPSLKQLQQMQAESMKSVGQVTQLGFGDPPEEYSLAVFKDRVKGDLHWALYMGEGANSMMVWDQVSQDAGYIHNLIMAQFPGFEMKPSTTGTARSSDGLREPVPGLAPAPAPPAEPPSPLRLRGKAILEGDLENLQISNVLQSVAMSKGTGRLELDSQEGHATVFFYDGAPIHCHFQNLEGAVAFLEVAGWDKGEFRFYPDVKHEKQTIKKRMDTLLMEGAALDDQYRAIRQRGLNLQSFLLRIRSDISEQGFEELLEGGIEADMTLQKKIYQAIDGKSRLADIVRRFSLTKRDWVPAIFNFTTCNLIDFVDALPSLERPAEEATVDLTQVKAVDKFLQRADTGLYTYPAFLWMLEREFWRWECFNRPLAIILLDISLRAEPGRMPEPMSIATLRAVAERINKMKRKPDVFTHFETFGFALLLPDTDRSFASTFAVRLTESLTTEPVGGTLVELSLVANFGVASIPEDSLTMGALIARARAPRRI